MKNMALTFLFLLLFFQTDTQSDTLQRQINEQVWKPFLESYDAFDAEKFMSIHHPEVLRVVQDGGRLLTFSEYAKGAGDSMEQGRESGRQRKLELRFTQRIATPENAFEVGFYKLSISRPDGSDDTYYGKFHVVLKKTEGRWKIWLDADTSEGANEEVFQAASPLE